MISKHVVCTILMIVFGKTRPGREHTTYRTEADTLMPESHERILRRIIRRFGSFPTTTYSYRIPSDVNVHITYGERSGRVLDLDKTCA